ncbi:MAG: hypothetical protein LBU48_07535 [Coriobacteriales bacterium]|nr:hypothetical protein [Coriobacteriales bacterium]
MATNRICAQVQRALKRSAFASKTRALPLSSRPLFGQLANSVVSDNTIRYNNIAEGVDLQYSV